MPATSMATACRTSSKANYESETNEYYRNLGSGVFEDLAVSSGFGPPGVNFVGFGLNLLDVDNDGDLDAFIANGHIFEQPRNQGITYAQRPFLMWNDGTGHFHEHGLRAGLREDVRRPQLGRRRLRQRRRPGHRRLELGRRAPAAAQRRNARPLGGDPARRPKSNREGVGARLVAETPSGKKLTRFVQAGNSYLSSSDPRVLFGLGAETSVKKLTINWPSGTVQVLENLPAGKYLKIEE